MGAPFNIQAELKGDVTVTPEVHPDERAARLKTDSRRALIQDYKDIAVFVVLLVVIVIVSVIAAYEGLWDTSAAPDTKRWAQTILSSLMTGGISFVVGRKIGGK